MTAGDARILAVMGSGETSPTMVKVHREILEHLGQPVTALLLDTPFGFQENARELAQKAQAYFRESLLVSLDVATMSDLDHRSAEAADDRFAAERLTAKIRDANYVFSGPGSPSYALRKWQETVVPALLKEKLIHGGAVTFASAAALTLGAFTVPVYEIYKVGADPQWLDGLDVMSVAGLKTAVIPHYNNAEGGTHDTRFCYLGETRLCMLEDQLPDDAFVIGVDEHTALVIDLVTGSIEVGGIGTVTVRKNGRSLVFAAGAKGHIQDLIDAAFATTRTRSEPASIKNPASAQLDEQTSSGESPLLAVVRDTEQTFDEALAARDATRVIETILDLEQQIHNWSSDVPGQDEFERARASLRSMILRVQTPLHAGLRDQREILGPYVEALIAERQRAREGRRFEEADEIRARLADLGVELRDSSGSTGWVFTTEP